MRNADKTDGSFLALLFRMKYITRWSRMYVTQPESLSIHTVECALLVHFLANIGNVYFGCDHDPDGLSAYALFHDATEIFTGDLPTPVKYFNDEIKEAYKKIEGTAAEALLSHLPGELANVYRGYFTGEKLDPAGLKLVKAADRLCAYLKCVTETRSGNPEFISAYEKIERDMKEMDCRELDFFLENCIDSFPLALDELSKELT